MSFVCHFLDHLRHCLVAIAQFDFDFCDLVIGNLHRLDLGLLDVVGQGQQALLDGRFKAVNVN